MSTQRRSQYEPTTPVNRQSVAKLPRSAPRGAGSLAERLNAELGEASNTPGFDDPPLWGVSHTVALTFAALDLDVVHRSTVRALLPAGRTRKPARKPEARSAPVMVRRVNGLDAGARRLIELGAATDFVPPEQQRTKSKNEMSEKFQKALLRFEQEGWIVRGEQYVLVRNRRALLDWATSASAPEWLVFPLAEAIDQINEDLRRSPSMTRKAVEQRRRELLAIKRLMEEGFGHNWSGRGSVRIVPKSRPL